VPLGIPRSLFDDSSSLSFPGEDPSPGFLGRGGKRRGKRKRNRPVISEACYVKQRKSNSDYSTFLHLPSHLGVRIENHEA
jgi:hypothetical protein